MVAGTASPPGRSAPLARPEKRARALLAQGMTRRDVAEQARGGDGIARNTAYRLVNEL